MINEKLEGISIIGDAKLVDIVVIGDGKLVDISVALSSPFLIHPSHSFFSSDFLNISHHRPLSELSDRSSPIDQ